MCINTDGFKEDLRVSSASELQHKVIEVMQNYNAELHLMEMKEFTQDYLSEHQFAQLIGKSRLYQHLPKSEKQKIQQSILCGVVIGFICGFVGAGGGMMLLLVLTSVLGYELKTGVGTSVFIMTFTALTGAISHFYIGGAPDIPILIACVISTLVFAQIGAKWANGANVKMLNRVTGILLCALGVVMLFF